MSHLLAVVGAIALSFSSPAPAPLQAASPQVAPRNSGEWPQATTVDGVKYTLNQPQFTGLSAGMVTMTSVLQMKPGDGPERSGTVTMTASMAATGVAGMVELNGFSITRVDGLADAGTASSALASSLQGMAFTLPLATLTEDITVTATRDETKLSTAVPGIVVTTKPTVMLTALGGPQWQPIGGTGWSRASNTPFILLRMPDTRTMVVRLGSDKWMKADALVNDPALGTMTGSFTPADAPPPAVTAALGNPPAPPEGSGDDVERIDGGAPTTPPSVMIATRPTVLVTMDGEPKVENIGGDIGLVTNTAQTVLVRNQTPRLWVLASGRWFSGDAWTGPWTFVPPSSVPRTFASVDTSRARVAAAMASVPGTPAAKEALVSTGLVRTVVLQRSKAACSVTWSGDPAYATVEGTDMAWATDSSQPVIRVGGAFYCCDSAAWFTSTSDRGPWKLCDAVPQQIYTIPASCPVYPVTFVQVYGSDADTVTFGFTSGYVGTYAQDGAVVFGTGYDGAAGPQTWGTQASYDQDTGTFAPPAVGAWGAWQPAVYPEVLNEGWAGWGWYPGWSAAYGWGWGHWGWNGGWDRWWNNWHPYDGNRWNDAWNDGSRANRLHNDLMNRSINDRAFDARTLSRAGTWNTARNDLRTPAADARTWNRVDQDRRDDRQAPATRSYAGDGGRRPVDRSPSGFHQANQTAARGGARR